VGRLILGAFYVFMGAVVLACDSSAFYKCVAMGVQQTEHGGLALRVAWK
jgi:hypothetical protein